MNNILAYKGFSARVEFDARDNIFFGVFLVLKILLPFMAKVFLSLEMLLRKL